MNSPATRRLPRRIEAAAAALVATLLTPPGAQADSFTSSASSAGSASSGSVSNSMRGSSRSSTGGDDRTAAVDYRIVELAAAPGRPGLVRITLQADDPQQQLVLDLPQAIAAQQRLGRGDAVQARKRVYGFEFARGDTQAAFYLVLDDDWYDDLAARPLSL
jgi:hypothetical protein